MKAKRSGPTGKPLTRLYTTRNMPLSLFDAVRLEAAKQRLTVERTVNLCLQLGLNVLAELAKQAAKKEARR